MSYRLRFTVSRFSPLLFAAVLAFAASPARADDSAITVKSGQKIAFLGDSITAFGAQNSAGYVNLVIAGLKANGVTASALPAGISGNTSKDMLGRLERDVLTKKPDFMTLSCGVNDVWHGEHGVALDQYKINITSIVDKAQATGIKVVILTSTLISEDPAAANNKKLEAYNEFLKSLAAEKKCPLVDLNAAEQAQLQALGAHVVHGSQITVDGVHMNLVGQQMMAIGVLKGFGLNDAELKKAQDAWLPMNGSIDFGKFTVTIAQYNQLNDLANQRNTTVTALLTEMFKKSIDDALAAKTK